MTYHCTDCSQVRPRGEVIGIATDRNSTIYRCLDCDRKKTNETPPPSIPALPKLDIGIAQHGDLCRCTCADHDCEPCQLGQVFDGKIWRWMNKDAEDAYVARTGKSK